MGILFLMLSDIVSILYYNNNIMNIINDIVIGCRRSASNAFSMGILFLMVTDIINDVNINY